jgi:hypothetical protein
MFKMPDPSTNGTLPAQSNGSRPKHPGGRPTKRTPEITAQIAEAIADGLNDTFVCDLVGITPETLIQWRKNKEFSYAIKSAEAARLQIRLRRIESGDDGWQGTAWFVERKYPRDWSRPELQMTVEHTGSLDHAITLVAETELRRMTEIRREIEMEVAA